MKLKKFRQIDVFFLIICLSYMIDIGNLKYALAGAFAALYALLMGVNHKNLPTKGVGTLFMTILVGIITLVAITFFKQIINGFQSYAINETIYFITPLFFVWVYVSNTNGNRISDMLDFMYCLCIFALLLNIIPNITIENILSIDLSKSYSPFENGYAYLFMLFEWLYLFKNQKKKAVLSYILCIICFKRFCIFAATLLLLFSKFWLENKKINRKMVNVSVVAFSLLPVFTCIALSADFENWFYGLFGVSLYEFTLSRSQRIIMIMESNEIKYGLGSTTVYLTKVFQDIHNSEVEQWNLHNDIVRFFVECGFLGSSVFTAMFFKAGSFCRATFILMVYIFCESYVNHLFGAGSVWFWIIAYMMLAYAKVKDEDLA